MVKRSIIWVLVLFFVTALFAEIGTAETISDFTNSIQFGGRQAVYANGDTIQLCYVKHLSMYPVTVNGGHTYFASSYDGGLTFPINRTIGVTPDGAPTLCKSGQTIIVTFTSGGYLFRAVSNDNGVTFHYEPPYPEPEFPNIPASDRLPITDMHDGEFHSIYANKEYTPDFYKLEEPFSQFYGRFTAHDKTSNDTPAYYWGPDVIEGTVRVNGDLWIKQLGGGTNNGWPTFKGPVYVSGQIQSYSGTPPYLQVFRGDYLEHVPEVALNPEITPANITTIGPADNDPNRIMMVTVNGNSYTTMIGQILTTGVDTLWVYTDYPTTSGTPLYANVVPHVDTLWTVGPAGVCSNNTMKVNSTLWIKGNFSGKQVWYSSDNVYLIDDITLSGTPVGDCPDGTVSVSSYNAFDKVAIVSGKNIIIKYGYKDPVTNIRMKPNCNDIWIYASLYALGEGNGNVHEDGVFTFEYQHPHPSVPAVTMADSLFDNIDMHRRPFPQTGISPWPGNIDYPYYNPLWPEGNPTMERGTVHVWGSITQRRRGFMHRGLADADYPNPVGSWNPAIDYCGGPAGNAYADPVLNTVFTPVNAAGATGAGVGYNKDIHFDSRIRSETFGFNPWNFGLTVAYITETGTWQTETVKYDNIDMVTKAYNRKNAHTLFSVNDRLYQYQNNVISDFPILNEPKGNIVQLNHLDTEHALIQMHDKDINFYNYLTATPDSIHVFCLDLDNGVAAPVLDSYVPTEMNDIAVLNNGLKIYAQTNDLDEVVFYSINSNNQMSQLYTWNPNQPALNGATYNFSRARLHIVPSGIDSFYVFIWVPFNVLNNPLLPILTNGTMYMARGSLANTGIDDDQLVSIPELIPSVFISPNPFRSLTTLAVNLPKNSNLDMKIYNIKGELIKSFKNEYKNLGTHKLTWDGRDNQGKAVSSGIYYYRCETDNNHLTGKMVLLK